MKNFIKLIFIIFLGYFLFACNNQNVTTNKKYCNLTIIRDSSFKNLLVSNVILTRAKDTLKFHDIVEFDTLSKSIAFRWDSLEPGEYKYIIKSIFRYEQNSLLNLKHDTIFKIENDSKIQMVDIISEKDLNESDTIEFAFASSGCYSRFESYMLTKNKYDYTLNGNYKDHGIPVLVNKNVSPEIIKGLFHIQTASRKCVKEKKDQWSTMSHKFFLLAKNKLFLFDDYMHAQCNYYFDFKKKYIEAF